MQSVRKGFQLNLGLMTVPVDLFSVVPSDKGRNLRTLCAEHRVPINQVYRCPKDDAINPDTVKGYETTKNQFTIVNPQELDQPTFDADDGMDIVAIQTVDIDNHTVPGGMLYYAQPHLTAIKAWEILFRLTQDRARTLVGVTALRKNSRKLFRLSIFNDYLVLQELQFPEHVREAPERIKVAIEKKLMDQAKQVLTAIEVDWAKYDLADPMLVQFRELISHGETVTVRTEATTETTNVIDLMDALKASVEASKKRRKA